MEKKIISKRYSCILPLLFFSWMTSTNGMGSIDAPVTFANTTYEWKLNYEDYNPYKIVESPEFHCEGAEYIKWKVRMYLQKPQFENAKYHFYLVKTFDRHSDSSKEITSGSLRVDYTNDIFVINEFIMSYFILTVAPEQRIYIGSIDKEYFNHDQNPLKILISVSLKVLRNVEVIDNQDQRLTYGLYGRYFPNLEIFLENDKLSDAAFVIENEKIPAHRLILFANSEKFAEMDDEEEELVIDVGIDDVDHETITEALRYMYTGLIKNLHRLAPKLLLFANEYDIEKLKAESEENICRYLSPKTAIIMLRLSIKENANKLKTCTMNYIAYHLAYIIDSEEFQLLMDEHPKLVIDIIKLMIFSTIAFV